MWKWAVGQQGTGAAAGAQAAPVWAQGGWGGDVGWRSRQHAVLAAVWARTRDLACA